MKKLLIAFIITLLSLQLTSPLLAVDEATDSATTDEQAEDNLQERIKNTVQENLNQAEDNIRQKLEEKMLLGYTGTITNIKEEIITADTNNNLYQIIFDDDTTVIRNGQSIDPEDLSIDEDIIIMGYLSSDDILTARRIVTTNLTPDNTIRQTLIGTLQEIDQDEDVLYLLLDDQPLEVDVSDFDFDEQLPQPQQQLMIIVATDTEEDTHQLLQLQVL